MPSTNFKKIQEGMVASALLSNLVQDFICHFKHINMLQESSSKL